MKKILLLIMSVICALSFALFATGCQSNTPSGASESERPSDNSDMSSGDTSDDNSDKTSDDSSDDSSDEPVEEKLEIIGPTGDVYGYRKKLRDYLTAEGDDVDVKDYVSGGREAEAYEKISIRWNSTCENVKEYRVELSTAEDFSEADAWTVNSVSRKLSVYNLYKSTAYYVKVTAVKEDGDDITDTFTFRTTDIGPRVMKIDGICNVRDLGGYKTASGKTTLQDKIFRGGQLSPNSAYSVYDKVALTESGKKYMSKTLGIKTDFDLRNATENKGLTESPIPNANLEYYNAGGYLSAFTGASAYRKIFSALADENRYPVYIHCTGGADRTGTVCFLINALLGVDEKTLIQDYETTSFSIFEMRSRKSTTYQFAPFLNKLKSDYAGDTLAEKTENYLLSIGVTETEIYNIKAIMFGEETRQPDQPQQPEQKETITLNSDNLSYTYENAVGYDGNVVTADIQSLSDDGNGGTYFFIGSYGFYYRGGLFRLAKAENGEYKEISPRVSLGEYARSMFNPGVKLGISVTVKDDSTVTIKAFINGTELFDYAVTRYEDEISADSAKFTVKITAMVTSLVMTKA